MSCGSLRKLCRAYCPKTRGNALQSAVLEAAYLDYQLDDDGDIYTLLLQVFSSGPKPCAARSPPSSAVSSAFSYGWSQRLLALSDVSAWPRAKRIFGGVACHMHHSLGGALSVGILLRRRLTSRVAGAESFCNSPSNGCKRPRRPLVGGNEECPGDGGRRGKLGSRSCRQELRSRCRHGAGDSTDNDNPSGDAANGDAGNGGGANHDGGPSRCWSLRSS